VPQQRRFDDARIQARQQARARHARAKAPARRRRGVGGLVTGVTLVIGAAVSAWIVISPPHADGMQQTHHQGAAGRPVSALKKPAAPTASATPTKRPTAPPSAKPTTSKPVAWHYRRDLCPEKALACVDLKDKISWLQTNGVVMYGPVRIEPGSPGQVTPTGVFSVSWKDKHHISNEFDEAMPDAIFFAPGGIAFHVGSLTKGSHGCVHMTTRDANYYWNQLQVGATVAVF
jgi:lipoprotein-anchoring transpeptidase ErfK/SrfK